MTTTISPSAIRLISVRQLGFPAFVPLGGALPVWAARDSKTAHCRAVSLRERWSNCLGIGLLRDDYGVALAGQAAAVDAVAQGGPDFHRADLAVAQADKDLSVGAVDAGYKSGVGQGGEDFGEVHLRFLCRCGAGLPACVLVYEYSK